MRCVLVRKGSGKERNAISAFLVGQDVRREKLHRQRQIALALLREDDGVTLTGRCREALEETLLLSSAAMHWSCQPMSAMLLPSSICLRRRNHTLAAGISALRRSIEEISVEPCGQGCFVYG